MRLALSLRWIRPVLALERERVVGPGGLDDGHALLEELTVARVLVTLAIPRPGRLGAEDGGVVLEPARLVAAHERDVEPAAEQMIEGGRVLGDAERIVRGQHVAKLIDPKARAVLAEEHRHQPRVLPELEPLDLQVMLRNADPRPARRIARARVLADLVQHPLVEHGVLAGHAALELAAPPDRHVHERVKVHRLTVIPPAASAADAAPRTPRSRPGRRRSRPGTRSDSCRRRRRSIRPPTRRRPIRSRCPR